MSEQKLWREGTQSMPGLPATATFGSDASPAPQQNATTPIPPVAWVFDGTDPDGLPLVRRGPLDPAERDAIANYLQNAPMLTAPGQPGPDQLDLRRGAVVPQTWHTDGQWIWSGSVIYYLHVHALSPQPELLEHLRRRRFSLGPVSEYELARALAVVNGTPIPAPRPPVEDVPPAPEPRPEPPRSDDPPAIAPDLPETQDKPEAESAVPDSERADPAEPDSAEPAGPDSPELTAALAQATDAAAALGIDPERFCVDGVQRGAWCLTRDGSGWQVFQQRAQSRKGTDFDTVHEAVTFFVGHLYLHRAQLQAAADQPDSGVEQPADPPSSEAESSVEQEQSLG
jgi:hypothetical protein